MPVRIYAHKAVADKIAASLNKREDIYVVVSVTTGWEVRSSKQVIGDTIAPLPPIINDEKFASSTKQYDGVVPTGSNIILGNTPSGGVILKKKLDKTDEMSDFVFSDFGLDLAGPTVDGIHHSDYAATMYTGGTNDMHIKNEFPILDQIEAAALKELTDMYTGGYVPPGNTPDHKSHLLFKKETIGQIAKTVPLKEYNTFIISKVMSEHYPLVKYETELNYYSKEHIVSFHTTENQTFNHSLPYYTLENMNEEDMHAAINYALQQADYKLLAKALGTTDIHINPPILTVAGGVDYSEFTAPVWKETPTFWGIEYKDQTDALGKVRWLTKASVQESKFTPCESFLVPALKGYLYGLVPVSKLVKNKMWSFLPEIIKHKYFTL